MDVQIEPSWKERLQHEFTKPYFQQIITFLKTEKASGKIIYPPGDLIFNAFLQTPFNEVKVVILDQDPYHGPGQAHGLSFSVPDNVKPPPSLVNIFKELQQDVGLPIPQNGNLTSWAKQGVLLLNAVLTVSARDAASHAKIGWMHFTDAVIKTISQQVTERRNTHTSLARCVQNCRAGRDFDRRAIDRQMDHDLQVSFY